MSQFLGTERRLTLERLTWALGIQGILSDAWKSSPINEFDQVFYTFFRYAEYLVSQLGQANTLFSINLTYRYYWIKDVMNSKLLTLGLSEWSVKDSLQLHFSLIQGSATELLDINPMSIYLFYFRWNRILAKLIWNLIESTFWKIKEK